MVLRIEPVLSAPTTAAAAVSIDLRRRVFPTLINPYNLKIPCATTETIVSHSSTLIEPASSLERAAMKTFQDLPSELVKDISTYLDGLSLSAFRLTSTWTSKIGLEVLAQRIRKSRFLVAPHSMGALLDISDHEHVAPKIDVLRLSTCGLTSGLYEFSNHLQEIHPGTDFYTPEESSVVRDWRKFEQHIYAHRVLARRRRGHAYWSLVLTVEFAVYRGRRLDWRCRQCARPLWHGNTQANYQDQIPQ